MSTWHILSALALGLLAGAHHALSGPDHLAGVAPLAVDRGRGAWRVGLSWGLGHASGASLAAAFALLVREELPGLEAQLSAVSETIVGVLLCAIGLFGLRRVLSARATSPDDAATRSEQAHDPSLRPHRHGPRVDRPTKRSRSAFVLGSFHGAAGLSHVFAVLPALVLPGTLLPATYLCGYAAGSLVAIALFAGLFGIFAVRSSRARRWPLGLASAASVVTGVVWIAHTL